MVFLREGLCPGLTEEVIQALRTQEIRTVEDLVSSELEELAQKCSISYKALVAIRRVLLTQHTGFPVSGADLYEELLSSMAILSTGNESLDVLLDAGLYTGEVTELAGGPGSGKTQVCLGVAVNISCVLKRTVLYIDTNGGLSASRLLQMVQSKTSNMEEQVEALNRILVCRVFDVFSLLETLHSLRSGGLEQASVRNGPIRAVLVDSVTAVLSHMLGGRQTEGMSLMIQVAGALRLIAKDLNVAVLVTNHVTRDGNGVLKAGLGQSWSHVPRTRVLLQRVDGPQARHSGLRWATLLKSSRQPCHQKQQFDLGSGGQPADSHPDHLQRREQEDVFKHDS
ncbi:DNA repair protein RAD51 homolog 4 isoform X1 [Lepisosteus oculatus]|uniref:DNA repair protein RAD51 homolog 4 isoform X1 n=1 Tax=Lepisosteus oculatus TaxID=7918 RepID=UPI00372331D1